MSCRILNCQWHKMSKSGGDSSIKLERNYFPFYFSKCGRWFLNYLFYKVTAFFGVVLTNEAHP